MAEQPLETDDIADALPKDLEEIFKPADVPAENTPVSYTHLTLPTIYSV